MVSRDPIPRPRQRSSRLDNRWDRLPGERKLLINYKDSFEGWISVGGTLLDTAPGLDRDLNAIISERHERHALSSWVEGQCACLGFDGRLLISSHSYYPESSSLFRSWRCASATASVL